MNAELEILKSWSGLTRPSKRRGRCFAQSFVSRRIRLLFEPCAGTAWMAGSNPAMTNCGSQLSARLMIYAHMPIKDAP